MVENAAGTAVGGGSVPHSLRPAASPASAMEHGMPPLVVKFGSLDSSPVCLQLNSNGTGFVRWSKNGSVACSLQDGKLFASHPSGAIAGERSAYKKLHMKITITLIIIAPAVFDYQGNGSIMSPSGTSLLSITNQDKSVASVYDTKGVFLCDINKNESQRDTNMSSESIMNDPQELSPTKVSRDAQLVSGTNLSWVFQGLEMEFLPVSWEVRVTVRNTKVHCEFSSITGGRILKVLEAKKEKKPKTREEVLVSYNHDNVRSELASVVNRLDSIMGSLNKQN